ncbi:MAG: ribonuclease P protein component [Patescibacteria group bacterium]|nr:ribonuclease P protein component [Patescibacteria group bacterium]
MFNRKSRLAKKKDVERVFARGRGFFNPYFTIKFLRKPGSGSRFTVVVSTKVSKRAVRRNRLKRLLREFIRMRLLFLTEGDYAVVVKPAAEKLPAKEYLEKFKELAVSARLLKT